MEKMTKKTKNKNWKKSKNQELSHDEKMAIANMHAALVFGPTYFFKK
jgi:hypothetical protein